MSLKLLVKKESEFTPEYIEGKLFSFYNIIKKYHHDTKSYAEHVALGGLYEFLGGVGDEIPEKLMGYMGGKRIGKIELDQVPEYSKENTVKVVESIVDFSYNLYKWAGDKKYCDVENIAQELSGEASKTIYLLTLS